MTVSKNVEMVNVFKNQTYSSRPVKPFLSNRKDSFVNTTSFVSRFVMVLTVFFVWQIYSDVSAPAPIPKPNVSKALKQKSAPEWVYIGSARGNAYYVDLSRERVKGQYWLAPAFVISSSGVRIFGKIAVDCAKRQYKVWLANQEFPWSQIGAGSPLGSFVENICI